MKKDLLIVNPKFGNNTIEVFYLKHPHCTARPATLTSEYHNNLPSEDLHAELEEVSEAAAFGTITGHFAEDPPHALCAPSVFKANKEDEVTEIKGCCPVGHKGHQGQTGLFEEELVIKSVLDQLQDTQLNISSNEARVFLAREIAKDLREHGILKDKYTQF